MNPAVVFFILFFAVFFVVSLFIVIFAGRNIFNIKKPMTMKKILFILTAIICMAVTAQAQTVYVSNGSDAVAYHKSKSCSYLQNSKDVKSVSTAEAKKMGRHECQRCYGTSAAAKKVTTTTQKKAAETKKKATEAKKATTPARDEKGRFIKKADTEKKTVEKKATEAKKKATETKKKTTEAKKKAAETQKKATTPARDEKGRFIKKADTEKATGKKTTKKAA